MKDFRLKLVKGRLELEEIMLRAGDDNLARAFDTHNDSLKKIKKVRKR